MGVFVEHGRFSIPRLSAIRAAIHRPGGKHPVFGRMLGMHEHQDVSRRLVNNRTAAMNALADRYFRPPGSAAILAAPGYHTVASPGGQNRAVQGDHDVRKTLPFENLLHVQP